MRVCVCGVEEREGGRAEGKRREEGRNQKKGGGRNQKGGFALCLLPFFPLPALPFLSPDASPLLYPLTHRQSRRIPPTLVFFLVFFLFVTSLCLRSLEWLDSPLHFSFSSPLSPPIQAEGEKC